MKKNKLKNMELEAVDLCKQGANQMSQIKLFKSAPEGEGHMEHISKSAGAAQVRDTTTALRKSLESIIADDSLTSIEKHNMMEESLQQFTEEASGLMGGWSEAIGKADQMDDPDDDPDFDSEDDPDFDPEDDPNNQEDRTNMEKKKSGCAKSATIDVGKMSPDDRAVWEGLQKKYGGTGGETDDLPIHPDVKKAIDEVAALRKSMDLEKLENFAKKYEIIGKKAPELAQKLYELKQAGEQHFNDYVALLNEEVAMANSGIFKEYGSNRTATDLSSTVADVMKANPNLTREQAIVKAYEMNPALDPFTGQIR